MEEKFVTSFDGTQIFYWAKKQTKTWLVFLHGGSGSSNSWCFQLPFFLSQGYSVIVLDQRGHGLSGRGKNLDFFSIDNFAKDVKAVLDAEQADKVVLVGHSLGSQIAQRFYQLYAESVVALVLISTKFARSSPKLLTGLVNFLMRLVFLVPWGSPNNNYTDYNRFTDTADFNLLRILSDIRSCSFKTYAAGILVGNHFENKNYQDIKVPSLLIHGEKDMIFPYKPVQSQAHEMSNFKFESLPTNHITLLNLPDEITKKIADFLVKLN
ncbi:MAG TPA: alpha/beta hydrolase [Candidatus Nanoarchaeia archaeon]